MMPLTRRQLRKAIDMVLMNDQYLAAFCIDFFPEIYKQFSTGMSRIEKLNILLCNALEQQIEAALCEDYPEVIRKLYIASNNIISATSNDRARDTLENTVKECLVSIRNPDNSGPAILTENTDDWIDTATQLMEQNIRLKEILADLIAENRQLRAKLSEKKA